MIIKQEKNLITTISSTKLYLDDIELIMAKFEMYHLSIEISDDENIYDSIEELVKIKGKNPKTIKILGRVKDVPSEFIQVILTQNTSSVATRNSNDLLKIGYEIEKLYNERKRKKIYVFFNSLNAKLNVLTNSVFAIAFYLYYNLNGKTNESYVAWLSFIVFWVVIYILSELNPDSNTKIELERKHNLSFYSKNKEKILFGIIMTIIGASITLVITTLTKK